MITAPSCGSGPATHSNPLLVKWWSTPYGIAPLDKIQPRDYMPAFEEAFMEQDKIIDKIVADTLELTFEGTILAFDNSDMWITDIFNIFSMVEASNSTPEMSRVSSELMPRLSAQQDKVLQNQELFAKIKELYDSRYRMGLNDEQLRLCDKVYDKFVRAGALLDQESRQRLAQINAQVAELRVDFSQKLLAENSNFAMQLSRQQIDGLPSMFRDEAYREAQRRGIDNRWTITLQPSSMVPFMTYAKSRELREELLKAYINRGKNADQYDRRDIVKRTTELRLERAKLLGYNNHAEYVTSQQMAKTPDAAYKLLDTILHDSQELAKDDLRRMKRLFDKDNPDQEFEAWDWWYYAERVRDNTYSLKDEALRVFFSVEGVRNGAFMLANRLYGVTFRPIITPQYAENCSSYEVIDTNGRKLGLLHLDLYTRPTKGQGAWCGYLREQRYQNGVRIQPIVSISCNFAQPKDSKTKSLLSTKEVETLFHEFGHAMHFLFRKAKYRGLSEVEGDLVELPSQLMERWAFEPEMLRLYALHHANGAVISPSLINNLTRSRSFNQSFERLEVAASALLDLDLHTTQDFELFDVDIFELNSLRTNTKRGLISEIEPRYYLSYFSHLFTFDYASGYYFYQWAEALEAQIFEKFKSSGDLFNRSLALRLRSEILERGGAEDGDVLFRNFMEPNK